MLTISGFMAKSPAEIKRAIIDLTRHARILGLHLQSAKTQLYSGSSSIEDLVTSRDAELGAIDYHMDIGYQGAALSAIQSVLDEVLQEDKFNERHFRKCLNSLRRLRSPLAVNATLQRLDELAPKADTLHRYLRLFVAEDSSIPSRIMRFLQDRDRNIYDWPEFWFAKILIEAEELPRDFLNWCRDRVESRDCHWNARSQYALILGKHGDPADRRLIQDLISSRDNEYERRAFIVALSDLPQPERGTVIGRFRTEYPHLAPAIELAA